MTQIPRTVENLGISSIDQQVISDQLGSIPGNIAKVLINAFSNIIGVVTLLVVTYYLLAERAHLHQYLIVFFGNRQLEKRIERFIDKLEHQIGGWIRGQLALMFIIGILTYVGLLLLKVNYALPLAIIAGLFEIIPNIGPTISMIPAVLIAATISPITALATLALYFLIQQFENNIIVPKVMQKAIGVRPLTTIVSLMIGLKLAGVLGAILAIPSYLVIRVVLEELYGSKRFKVA
jgi:predicted PurR-regulated permease PerM